MGFLWAHIEFLVFRDVFVLSYKLEKDSLSYFGRVDGRIKVVFGHNERDISIVIYWSPAPSGGVGVKAAFPVSLLRYCFSQLTCICTRRCLIT